MNLYPIKRSNRSGIEGRLPMKSIVLLTMFISLVFFSGYAWAVVPTFTINFPENITYHRLNRTDNTYNITLNWTSDQYLDDASYELNGANNVSLETKGGYTNDSWGLTGGAIYVQGITHNDTYIWVTDISTHRICQYWHNGSYTGTCFASGGGRRAGITHNGTHFFVVDETDKEVYIYWMNGSYTGAHFDTSVDCPGPWGITMNETYIWITEANSRKIVQYWTNGSYTGTSFDISSEAGYLNGIDNDGTYFWVVDSYGGGPDPYNRVIYQYWMNGSYTGNFFNITESGNTNPKGITQNGTYFWLVNNDNDRIYKYYQMDPINTITASEGSNIITIYGNNSLGELTSIILTFTVDTNSPDISFIAPTPDNGTTNYINYTFINISLTETNHNISILSWNGTNETMSCTATSCGVNKTDQAEGQYDYYVWANDTAGNMAQTETRVFIIDRTPPMPVISSPVNNSIIIGAEIELNYSINELHIDTCLYEIDNNENVSIPGCANITIPLTFGEHNLTLYINDTAGNINHTSILFNTTFAEWNITLFTENDWDTLFDTTLPDSVTLFLFCFGLDTETYNMSSSNIFVSPNCEVETLMIRVEYPTDSYTREILAVSSSNTSVSMYLVDAFNETLLQIPFIMGDSPFFGSNLTIYKISQDGQTRILSQGRFDVEFKHNSYLIKDNKYNLRITQGSSIREIGFFQSVAAGTQTININQIQLGPDITLIGNNLIMSAETDDVTQTLIIEYTDLLDMTNSVQILVFNDTSLIPFYNMTFVSSDVTVTLAVNTSNRFTVKWIVSHQSLGNFPIYFTAGAGGFGFLFDLGIAAWIYPVIGFIFTLFTSFTITPRNRLVGIVVIAVVLSMMAFAAWTTANTGVALILVVFIGLAVVYEIRRLGLT